MNKNLPQRFWLKARKSLETRTRPPWVRALIVLFMVLSPLISVFATYHIYFISQPLTEFCVSELNAIDVREMLGFLTGGSFVKEDLGIRLDEKSLQSLHAYTFRIENSGNTPIRKTDFDEPLGFSVAPPWRIIHLEEVYPMRNRPTRVWHQPDEQHIMLEPCLFNPHEQVTVELWVATLMGDEAETKQTPELNWAAHIANVSSIKSGTERSSIWSGMKTNVWLVGWQPHSVVVLCLLLFLVSVLAASWSGYIPRLRVRQIALLLLLVLLSLTTAEIAVCLRSTYGLSLWPGCWLLLALHVLVLLYVLLPVIRRIGPFLAKVRAQ